MQMERQQGNLISGLPRTLRLAKNVSGNGRKRKQPGEVCQKAKLMQSVWQEITAFFKAGRDPSKCVCLSCVFKWR